MNYALASRPIHMSEVLDRKNSKRNAKFDKLIGPTDSNVDYNARERLITARISLLLRHSFFERRGFQRRP